MVFQKENDQIERFPYMNRVCSSINSSVGAMATPHGTRSISARCWDQGFIRQTSHAVIPLHASRFGPWQNIDTDGFYVLWFCIQNIRMWLQQSWTIPQSSPLGGMVTIPSHGWFMTFFYPHYTYDHSISWITIYVWLICVPSICGDLPLLTSISCMWPHGREITILKPVNYIIIYLYLCLLPSGKLTVCYGNWAIYSWFTHKNGDIP